MAVKDSSLSSFLTRPGVESDDDVVSAPAFGYLRGVREQAVMLQFRFANGNRWSYPYSWLGSVKYDGSAGILCTFVGDRCYRFLIEGSNLLEPVNGVDLLEMGIGRHRIVWIRELSVSEMQAMQKGQITVEKIHSLVHPLGETPPRVDWLEPFLEGEREK